MYAPGVDIYAAGSYKITGMILFSGTSAAAPFVAGVLALLAGLHRTLTPQELRDVLETRYTSEIHCGCVPNRIVFSNGL